MSKTITIGGASGFWGDAALATPQLLATEKLDYIVYDYLAFFRGRGTGECQEVLYYLCTPLSLFDNNV